MSENLLCLSNCPLPCESQPHKGHLASKLKYRRFPSYLLSTLLLFPFHLLPSPVHPIGFSSWFFPGYLVVTEQQQRLTNLDSSFLVLEPPKFNLVPKRKKIIKQVTNASTKIFVRNRLMSLVEFK